MKIEMCESLCASWLKHVKECQIVQTNWRPHCFWDESRFQQIETSLDGLNKSFQNKGFGSVFPKKKGGVIDALQIITMTECDVVGVKFNLEGQVERVYAVEAAFHSDGLHYKRTASKVVSKLVKDVFALNLCLGAKKVEAVFVSPLVKPAPMKAIQKMLMVVKEYFNSGEDKLFDCAVRFLTESEFSAENLISNDLDAAKRSELLGFEKVADEIVKPLIAQLPLLDDDSELFMRSMLMRELCQRRHLPVRSSLRSALRKLRLTGSALSTLQEDCLKKLTKPGDRTAIKTFLAWRKELEKMGINQANPNAHYSVGAN